MTSPALPDPFADPRTLELTAFGVPVRIPVGGRGRDEAAEIEARIKRTKLSKEARDKAQAELKKLKGMQPMSAEAVREFSREHRTEEIAAIFEGLRR